MNSQRTNAKDFKKYNVKIYTKRIGTLKYVYNFHK